MEHILSCSWPNQHDKCDIRTGGVRTIMSWLLMHQTIGCDEMLYKPPLQPANIFLDCNVLQSCVVIKCCTNFLCSLLTSSWTATWTPSLETSALLRWRDGIKVRECLVHGGSHTQTANLSDCQVRGDDAEWVCKRGTQGG